MAAGPSTGPLSLLLSAVLVVSLVSFLLFVLFAFWAAVN